MGRVWILVPLLLTGCAYVFDLEEVSPIPDDMACSGQVCIDVTEVTVTRYDAFVQANPPEQHPACAGNDIVPPNWAPAPNDEAPVVHVDWCDAWAFCAWEGKRLCGQIGGGPLAPSARNMIERDEWYFACTGGNADNTYPYGPDYAAGACSDSGEPIGIVGDHPACEGGLLGLLDMSGRVWEWVDACNSNAPDADCDTRGGAFYEPAMQVTCGTYTSLQKTRNAYHAQFLGFRCCRDP